jgi:cytochrome bd ubiquinol oxidase subunit II
MSLAAVLAIVLGLVLTAYAVLAGADFGAGILDLTTGERDQERAALARTIGPLWEANHVWLIFAITILFSAFPSAFAAVGTAMLAPLTLALLAIVVRGVAFALRADAAGAKRSERLLSRGFGAASVAAPLLFGASAAALAEVSSARHSRATVTSVPWTGVFPGIVGLLAVALCAQLAACFLTLRLQNTHSRELVGRFRRRGLQAGLSVLVLSGLSLAAAAWRAPALWQRLDTAAVPAVLIALLATGVSLFALARRHYLLARAGSVLAVSATVWGWFLAQSPRLVGSRLTVHTAAATPAALTALAIAGTAVLIAVIPAFYLLYVLFGRPSPEVTE